MQDKITSLFSSDDGRRIYDLAIKSVEKYSMNELFDKGVLIGLSGGADSVMLLCFLLEYRRRNFEFPILAVHINHGIRGDDADADERFSRDLCSELGVQFISRKIDVPGLAKIKKTGIEECARNLRYLEFKKIIQGREDIGCIVVAHNADDNIETVILNMLRGSGTRGAAGIPPVRDNIARPLIKITKGEIVEALNLFDIPFVIDKTNFDNDYKRNYVRNEILPKFAEISEKPALMIGRMSDNLRSDDEFINNCAEDFISLHKTIKNYDLLSLHKSLRARVIALMAQKNGVSLSSVNFDNIFELLKNDNFHYSLPGRCIFRCERGVCSVLSENDYEEVDYLIPVHEGENLINEFDSAIYLTNERININSLNIYKLSIQADISSAIIEGDLYLRPKKDGDTLFYGGMTHKIKKLYNDRKIPVTARPLIPMLCDSRGIVWAPGFGVRDDNRETKAKNAKFAFLCIGLSNELAEKRFYSGSEFK